MVVRVQILNLLILLDDINIYLSYWRCNCPLLVTLTLPQKRSEIRVISRHPASFWRTLKQEGCSLTLSPELSGATCLNATTSNYCRSTGLINKAELLQKEKKHLYKNKPTPEWGLIPLVLRSLCLQGLKWNAPLLWQFQYGANFLLQANRSGAV